MRKHNLSIVSEAEHRSGHIVASRAGTGAVAIGLLLGGGAAYFLGRASADALATTSRVLIATGLAGLVLMAVVVAIRLLTQRDGEGDRPPGQRIPIGPMAKLGAGLFVVGDHGQLRPIPERVTGGHPQERRSA